MFAKPLTDGAGGRGTGAVGVTATGIGGTSWNGLGCPFGVMSVAGAATTGVVTTGVGLGTTGRTTSTGFIGSGMAGADGAGIIGAATGFTSGIVGIMEFGNAAGIEPGVGIFRSGMDGDGGVVPMTGGIGTVTGVGADGASL